MTASSTSSAPPRVSSAAGFDPKPMDRERRAKRSLTSKGEPNGRCIRQEYSEQVVGEMVLPDGRSVKIVRGIMRYLHVTKGWRVRAMSGLKYQIVANEKVKEKQPVL